MGKVRSKKNPQVLNQPPHSSREGEGPFFAGKNHVSSSFFQLPQPVLRKPDLLAEKTTKGRSSNLALAPFGRGIQPKKGPWFEEPKKPGTKGRTGIKTRSRQAHEVFVEKQLSNVQIGKNQVIHVRFAYPKSEIAIDQPSSNVTNTKQQVLLAIAGMVGDLLQPSPQTDKQKRLKDQQLKAKMQELFILFPASDPLNVFIETYGSHQKFTTVPFYPVTSSVYIDPSHVGTPAKLKAAIRMPFQRMIGGLIMKGKKLKTISAPGKAEKKNTMLHELLHVLLINKKCDANSLYAKAKSLLKVTGTGSVKSDLVKMIKGYLVAQEELFVYNHVGMIYPPVGKQVGLYNQFIQNVEALFGYVQPFSAGYKVNKARFPIKVKQKVARQRVKWDISYKYPSFSVNLDQIPSDKLTVLKKFIMAVKASWPAH